MPTPAFSIRRRLDRAGVLLSGLCAVHCLLGLFLVTVLGLGGELFMAPEIHRIGLGLAIGIGAATLGLGAMRHGQLGPLLLGGLGLSLMAGALMVGHGPAEGVLTIAGVTLLAAARIRNLRAPR